MAFLDFLNPFKSDEDTKQDFDTSKPLAAQVIPDKKSAYAPLAAKVNMPVQQDVTQTISDEDAEKQKSYFLGLINSVNDSKPSFHEFLDSITELAEVIPDKTKLFQKAYNILAKQGLTKQALLAAGNKTLKILQDDATNFNAAINQQLADALKAKKSQLSTKQKLIEMKNAQIEQLKKDVEAATAELGGMQDDIDQTQKGYEAGAYSYNYFSKNITDQIQGTIGDITAYLQ